MSRVRITTAGCVVGITKFVKRQRILTRRRCLQRKFISLSISNPVHLRETKIQFETD